VSRVLRNYAGLTIACIVGVAFVLIFAASSTSFSSLTLILAFFTFASVIAAAMLIAWAAEASQYSISQGLALAVVAIVQTLPEFFVEGAIAWNAGSNWLASQRHREFYRSEQATHRPRMASDTLHGYAFEKWQ